MYERGRTDTITELFLLTPEDVVGEVGTSRWIVRGIECFAEDVFLHSVLGDHLLLWIDRHGDVKECFVKEGNTSFKTPGHGGFVGTKTI